MTAALHIEDLRVEYGPTSRGVEVVHGVSLTVEQGEFVAIVGESGSGKSTTAHAVLGLLPGQGRITGGRIQIGEVDVSGWSDKRLDRIRGSQVGLIPQDPMTSLNPVRRIGDQVAETVRLHRPVDRRGAYADAVDALRDAGLSSPETRARQYPHELSGGMRQRVLIANAWACHPPLVIADEPTSALDVTVQKLVLDRFDALRADQGTAVLFITHDLAVALERSDRILVMRDGRIVDEGTPQELAGRPTGTYTRTLLEAAPSVRRHVLVPTLGITRRRQPADPAEAAVVEATGLTKSFRLPGGGEVVAVANVSLRLGRGETLSLVGESGSGKSTTARIVARLTAPDAGTLLLDGDDSATAGRDVVRRWRRRAAFVYQSPYSSLDPRSTVARIVSEPLRAHRVGDRAARTARVHELLDRVALPREVADRRPGALSGGQRQRVAIARALALQPELLVLDEPVSALDASVQAQILQLLVDLRAEFGLTYLFISHDLAVVRQISDRVAVMTGGRVVEEGATAHIFEAPQHEYTRRLLASIPEPGVHVPA
ncbi:ABC transporter ATP-binding protein [Microbacterium trichothecenolyticum]|uniref:dipeptide ABC transporter ATP-binding protein n=1 Tax=Microbacterium trichothecenolyticum TaxID=69370 RepID=UPI001C6F3A1E|nr:ABC transporter ATP-binding protein [Microbacterium trichothecenolyticum]MBW9121903.1 ABC transporter ATP-binding protein [Microbacterium trichothecenolyticum]